MRIDPSCKACGGTGKNSRGNPCSPCQANGQPVLVLPPREHIHSVLMARSAEIKAGIVDRDLKPENIPVDRDIKPANVPVDPALEGFL